jgi:hypothetical protein
LSRACSTKEENRNASRILVERPVGKRPTGRQQDVGGWVILKWILQMSRMGWDGMDWIDLAQDSNQWRALVNTVMNLRVP